MQVGPKTGTVTQEYSKAQIDAIIEDSQKSGATDEQKRKAAILGHLLANEKHLGGSVDSFVSTSEINNFVNKLDKSNTDKKADDKISEADTFNWMAANISVGGHSSLTQFATDSYPPEEIKALEDAIKKVKAEKGDNVCYYTELQGSHKALIDKLAGDVQKTIATLLDGEKPKDETPAAANPANDGTNSWQAKGGIAYVTNFGQIDGPYDYIGWVTASLGEKDGTKEFARLYKPGDDENTNNAETYLGNSRISIASGMVSEYGNGKDNTPKNQENQYGLTEKQFVDFQRDLYKAKYGNVTGFDDKMAIKAFEMLAKGGAGDKLLEQDEIITWLMYQDHGDVKGLNNEGQLQSKGNSRQNTDGNLEFVSGRYLFVNQNDVDELKSYLGK